MSNLVLQMLKGALDAFVNQDPVAARALIPRDKEVDALNKKIYGDLSNQMMHDPETVAVDVDIGPCRADAGLPPCSSGEDT